MPLEKTLLLPPYRGTRTILRYDFSSSRPGREFRSIGSLLVYYRVVVVRDNFSVLQGAQMFFHNSMGPPYA